MTWEDPFRGVPSNYVSRCEAALAAYENDGELPPGWTMPPVRDDDEDIEEEPFDPKKPPEPRDTLNIFEWQRSISKLIERFVDYAAYQRRCLILLRKPSVSPVAGLVRYGNSVAAFFGLSSAKA